MFSIFLNQGEEAEAEEEEKTKQKGLEAYETEMRELRSCGLQQA